MAPGTAAPLGSLIVPAMLPGDCWSLSRGELRAACGCGRSAVDEDEEHERAIVLERAFSREAACEGNIKKPTASPRMRARVAFGAELEDEFERVEATKENCRAPSRWIALFVASPVILLLLVANI